MTAAATFVHELGVTLDGADERRLASRFNVARDAYNALLHEGLRRMDLLEDSRAYRMALRAPRGTKRNRLLNDARKHFGFRKYDLCQWGSHEFKRSWISSHLDREALRALGHRAFEAIWQYYRGLKGRPRFKGPNQFDSIEGQSNRRGLHFHRGLLKWYGLQFRIRFNEEDPFTQHALRSRIKHVRLIRRRIRGCTRYFIQLVCEGQPFGVNGIIGSGTIAIDPGPRVFALVSTSWAKRVDLITELRTAGRIIRRLQRGIERKRRAGNPGNYLPTGAVRPGKKVWRQSRSQLRQLAVYNEIHRRARAARKADHGRLINALLSLATEFRIERNSYRAYRHVAGKSVAFAGPGAFVRRLERKAANAGARVVELPSTLRFSQVCQCGQVRRKTLSERTHLCDCGVGPVQRDLYSAVLMLMSTFDPARSRWKLDADQIETVWSSVGSRLPAASRTISIPDFVLWSKEQAASDGALAVSPRCGTELLAGEVAAMADEARDDVGNGAEGSGEFAGSQPVGALIRTDDPEAVF